MDKLQYKWRTDIEQEQIKNKMIGSGAPTWFYMDQVPLWNKIQEIKPKTQRCKQLSYTQEIYQSTTFQFWWKGIQIET